MRVVSDAELCALYDSAALRVTELDCESEARAWLPDFDVELRLRLMPALWASAQMAVERTTTKQEIKVRKLVLNIPTSP